MMSTLTLPLPQSRPESLRGLLGLAGPPQNAAAAVLRMLSTLASKQLHMSSQVREILFLCRRKARVCEQVPGEEELLWGQRVPLGGGRPPAAGSPRAVPARLGLARHRLLCNMQAVAELGTHRFLSLRISAGRSPAEGALSEPGAACCLCYAVQPAAKLAP